MNKTVNFLCGAHMSISGEITLAIERGASIGATAIQIFTKNNRQWHAKPLEKSSVEAFKTAQKKSSIKSVIAHASYLINIGSPDHTLAEKSVTALADELKRCNILSIPYLVFHPGSHNKTDETECLKRIAVNIDKALEQTDKTTSLLIEIMAGQGNSICYTFEQIATILHHVHHKKNVGVCFDTCHAFAAGYNFSTTEQYNKMWKDFDTIIGLDKLHAIHLNDSKGALGSRIDRHENIGKGMIGMGAFKLLINDPRFYDIPKILETPYATLEDHKKNLLILLDLIT